ncbi:MAG: RagB/SusD family nutrient uptake outer membrane protein [Flavobacteriaceae bacterium]|nr:RagB/SusD family nutrient uptake outer membrane protein [Flavobacteriaceae bacterium]
MKNIINKFLKVFCVGLVAITLNCDTAVEEEIFSQLAAGNYLTSQDGIETLLFSAYSQMNNSHAPQRYFASELPFQDTWGRSGSWEERTAEPLTNFTWNSASFFVPDMWVDLYRSIRDVNIVLKNLGDDFPADFKSKVEGEARALRASAYQDILAFYGPGPLITQETETLINPRASEGEMQTFIETEFNAAIGLLPSSQSDWGRFDKGMAMGSLLRFYMNTKQYSKAITLSKQIMDLGKYSLDPSYTAVFAANNQGNSEIIYPVVKAGTSQGMWLICVTLPRDYPRPDNQGTCAAVVYGNDWFMDLFEPDDIRGKDHMIRSYTSNAGADIVGYGINESIMLKYPIDPGASGAFANNNDYPHVRYGDVLMHRAEALNETSGPSQEVIDLVNQIRTRAGASAITLAAYSTKSALKAFMMEERRREFFWEGKLREDAVRNGVYISTAQSKGKPAQDHHVLYPIPLAEMDANKEMTQNPGY